MDDLIKSLDLWAQTDSPERAALFAQARDELVRTRAALNLVRDGLRNLPASGTAVQIDEICKAALN